MNYAIIVASVLLNALAQLFLKRGMIAIGEVSLALPSLLSLVVKAATNIPVLCGMASYAVSILLWMVVLSRVNVSLAYPFSGIGYVFTTVFAYFIFHEPLTAQKIAGILVICVGIAILGTSRG
jgi:multidrug transporter EmrE-like cation transporter